jgi:hypothetical protein
LGQISSIICYLKEGRDRWYFLSPTIWHGLDRIMERAEKTAELTIMRNNSNTSPLPDSSFPDSFGGLSGDSQNDKWGKVDYWIPDAVAG